MRVHVEMELKYCRYLENNFRRMRIETRPRPGLLGVEVAWRDRYRDLERGEDS